MNTEIEKNIQEKIGSGQIKMKPKFYFMAKTVIYILAFAVFALFAVYLVSFIVFSLRASGLWFLPGFGFMGFRILFGSLPWLLIFSALALIGGLEIFAEHFSFIYRRPLIYSLGVIIVLVLVFGFVVGRSSFHAGLFRQANQDNLPLIGGFYRRLPASGQEIVFNGIIAEKKGEKMIVEDVRGAKVEVPAFGRQMQNLKEGDMVVVVGKKDGKNIEYVGLRKLKPDPNLFPMRGMRGGGPGRVMK